jgi:hypothetical protein
MSYAGGGSRSTVHLRDHPLAKADAARPPKPGQNDPVPADAGSGDWPKRADGSPDFDKMTSAQRNAYDAWRLKRVFG